MPFTLPPLPDQELIENLRGKRVVVKLSGSVLEQSDLLHGSMEGIDLIRSADAGVILVHGGGRQLTEAIGKGDYHPDSGLRRTDKEHIPLIEEEIVRTGKMLVSALEHHGISSVSLPHSITQGQRRIGHRRTGDPTSVNREEIFAALEKGQVPVVPFGGIDEKTGETLNINADAVAANVAQSVQAIKLLLLTEGGGIRIPNKKGVEKLLPVADLETLTNLLRRRHSDGTPIINKGNVPKVHAAIEALTCVPQVHIVQATRDAIAEELFTRAGSPGATLIERKPVLHGEYPAGGEYLPHIMALRREGSAHMTPKGTPLLKPLSENDVRKLLPQTVALLQRTMLVGTACWEDVPDHPEAALIGGFIVAGQHQGSGYSSILLQAMFDRLHDADKHIAFSITASPELMNVFEKHGKRLATVPSVFSKKLDRYGDERSLVSVFEFNLRNGT